MDIKGVPQSTADKFLYLIIKDTEFLQTVRNTIPISIFTAYTTNKLISLVYEFFDKYKEAPRDHFLDILKEETKNTPEETKLLLYRYIERFANIETPNKTVVLDLINQAAVETEFITATEESYELIKEGKISEARVRMEKAYVSAIPDIEVGTEWTSAKTEEVKLPPVILPTGFPSLDWEIGGFRRQQVVCFLGKPKGKKSWILQYMSLRAIQEGLNVFHVSHENSTEECFTRYDQMVSRTILEPRTGATIPVIGFSRGKVTITEEFVPSVFTDTERVRKAKESFWNRFTGRLFVHKFPMRTAKMSDIECRLDAFERKGIKIDVLINDYPDIMNLSGYKTDATRDSINEIYCEHKRIADSRDMLVFVASQSNREGIKKQILTMQDFAEDIRKIGNVDAAFSICEGEDPQNRFMYRLYVIGGRNIPMGVGVSVGCNIKCGEVVAFSEPAQTILT